MNVPVKVVSALRQKEVRFHQVHAADGGRIRYRRVCEADGEEVPYEEIARMNDEGGPAVMVTTQELKELEADKSDLIEILDFVELAEVDPLYYDKAYYLLPDRGGDKAYRLLVEAMRKGKRVGIAKFVFRDREKLVAIRPVGDALSLTTLNYADEVVDPASLEGLPEDVKTARKEVEMAGQLIASLHTPFDPAKYEDEHRQRVLDLLEAKREGGALMPVPKAARPPTTDLARALEESLKAARAARKGAT